MNKEMEALIAAMAANIHDGSGLGPMTSLGIANRALDAIQASGTHVVVPVKLTEAMAAAGFPDAPQTFSAYSAWDALLTAAKESTP